MEAHFGVLNFRCPYGPQGNMLRGCYNRSVLHRKAFQAEHRNQSGGAILIKLEIKALGRDGTAQGGLTEQKRAWQEPSFCGVPSFSQHIQSIRCQHWEVTQFPDLQCPGTLCGSSEPSLGPAIQCLGPLSKPCQSYTRILLPTTDHAAQPSL